jgi:hypothetical protein
MMFDYNVQQSFFMSRVEKILMAVLILAIIASVVFWNDVRGVFSNKTDIRTSEQINEAKDFKDDKKDKNDDGDKKKNKEKDDDKKKKDKD